VHSVRIDGLVHVDRTALAARLGIAATSWNPLAARRYLDAYAIAEDEPRIVAFCQARGYHGARVLSAEAQPRPGGKSVDVHFVIAEGEPTRITSVAIEDGDPQIEPRVEKALGGRHLKVGEVFDSDRYLEQRDLLGGALKERGYPWAVVTATAEVDRDRRVATVRYAIDRGPLSTWDGVSVVGTVAIDPARVVAETRVDPGDPFRLSAVDAARDKAYHLGVFASVKTSYQRVPGQPERVRLLLTVKESTFNELRLGVGFGLDALHNEVHVDGIYARHNFLGGLRTLQLRLTPAYIAMPAVWDIQRHGPALTAEATLTQPRVSFLSQIQLVVGYDLGVDYAYQFHGPRGSLGVMRLLWRDRVSLALSYNLQFLTFFNTDPAILQDPAQSGRFFGFVDPYRVAWWQQSAVLDLRDRPLDTTRGVMLLADAEEGGVYAGGAFDYEKLRGEARAYAPLGGRVVLAARAQFGHLFVQGALGSPVTRRFYLGGPSSHRGFNYGRLSLQVPSGVAGAPPIPVGGDEMFLAQLELRVNLVNVSGAWIAAAVFFDTGDVSAPSCGSGGCALLPAAARAQVDFSRLHHAVGAGLRLKTIIGTLRLDVGVRLNRLAEVEPDGLPNPDPGQRVAVHLSVGEAF